MAKGNVALARERIGHVLRERWLLEKVLGVGGMAAVYQARHRNGARAAIKLLHGPLSEDSVVRERFLREAYLANTIDHVGVVRVLDDDADPQLGPFIVMELLEGESVLDLLDRGMTLSPDRCLELAEQALDVLAVAHDRGIVHRDLKPANLFLCDNGAIKVLDFGIARLLDDNQARLTRTGVPLGTPAYMAPEQARGLGRHVDGRADLYALGATLFRVLAGRHVHVGQGAEQIALVATRRAPKLATAAPHVPGDICAVIDRSLEFEPERRYGNALEMQADIRAVRTGSAPMNARAPLPTPASLPRISVAPQSPDMAQLAEEKRAEARARAKQPNAFYAPRTIPPVNQKRSLPPQLSPQETQQALAAVTPPPPPSPSYPDVEDEDNMPTVALPAKDFPMGPRPKTLSESPRLATPLPIPSPIPSTPGRPASTRPLARPVTFPDGSERSATGMPMMPRIQNVPVPALTPTGGVAVARRPTPHHLNVELDPSKETPTLTQHLGAVVLPAPMPKHFEDTQYRIESRPVVGVRSPSLSETRADNEQTAVPVELHTQELRGPPPVFGPPPSALAPTHRTQEIKADPRSRVIAIAFGVAIAVIVVAVLIAIVRPF